MEENAKYIRLLQGVEAENELLIGGDTTGEAAGIDEGHLHLETIIQPISKLISDSGNLTKSGLYVQLNDLHRLAETWKTIWLEREKSATILARLRQADKAGSHWRNASSLIARIAVIALLIYLVNILVNLYRYNMRLAAFYQARRDAIEMALASGADLTSMVQGSLADLATSNTPEEVTFGPRPALPTDALLKAVPELAKIVKR